MSIWDRLRYFGRHEFRHPDEMSEELLLRLDEVRHEAGVPIGITSDYRPGDGGAHGRGLAVDISGVDGMTSRWRFLVLRAAFKLGWHRIGVYDHHVHLDIDDSLAPEVCWHGGSR